MTSNQITTQIDRLNLGTARPEAGLACRPRQLLLCVAMVCLPGLIGCAALRPLDGLPARHMPDSLKGPSRSGKKTIDLSLLSQRRPLEHRVDSGDVLGIYIEGVLGRREDVPPVHFPEDSNASPSMGYPIPVRADGTISLPMLRRPLLVRNMTLRQIEETIYRAYTVDRQLLNGEATRILVGLQKPRQYRVLVIRQEAGDTSGGANTLNLGSTKRGTGEVVSLPAYENDVMHALTATNGLPGLDAENTIYIIRNRERREAPAPASPVPTTVPQTGPVLGNSSRSPIQQTAGYSTSSGWGQPVVASVANSQYSSYRMAPATGAGMYPQAGQVPGPGTGQYMPYQQPSAGPTGYPQAGPLAYPQGTMPHPQGAYPVAPGQYSGHPVHPAEPSPDPISERGYRGELPFNLADYGVQDMTVENSRVTRIPVRLRQGERPEITEDDIILNDGDIVFIESRETEIFYTGGLLGGGQYTLPRDYDLDVLGAIAIAQGTGGGRGGGGLSVSSGGISALNQDVTISASKLIVLRTMPNGTQVSIKVDLYKALRNPAERMIIQPGDYLILQYTPVEAVGAWLERYVLGSAIFGIAAGQASGNN